MSSRQDPIAGILFLLAGPPLKGPSKRPFSSIENTLSTHTSSQSQTKKSNKVFVVNIPVIIIIILLIIMIGDTREKEF